METANTSQPTEETRPRTRHEILMEDKMRVTLRAMFSPIITDDMISATLANHLHLGSSTQLEYAVDELIRLQQHLNILVGWGKSVSVT